MPSDWTSGAKATTQDVILKRVGDLLIASIPIFTVDNVIYTLDPDPPEEMVHDLTCAISPMEGSFDQSAMDGGGNATCIEQSGVLVSVWSRQLTDQTGHARHILLGLDDDKTRSLLKLKRSILKALTGELLNDPQDGNQLLVEAMLPLHSQVPRFSNWDRHENMADIAVGFSTVFLWDLQT